MTTKQDFPTGRFASLKERALERVLVRLLGVLQTPKMGEDTEFYMGELDRAKRHLLRRIAWRKRAKRSSVTDRRKQD